MKKTSLVICLFFGLACAEVGAHKLSDSYLNIKVEEDVISGQWDLALRDLEYAIGLDANGDSEITWGELRASHRVLEDYLLSRIVLSFDDEGCALRVTEHLVDYHTDGAYAVVRFEGTAPPHSKTLEVGYGFLFDLDPLHRGLAKIEYGGLVRTAIFSPAETTQQYAFGHISRWQQFLAFAKEGIHHIMIGFDHVLFLIALLLPAVLYREAGKWVAVTRCAPALISLAKIVTAFTIAHSITLTLAVLEVVSLPARFGESVIAASVLLAALNNLRPVVREETWVVAFVFGLIHGFGFASVLADIGLISKNLVLSLVGFNCGVELGQLAIVGLFIPAAFLSRNSGIYQKFALMGGSAFIAAISMIWMVERILGIAVIT